MDDNVGNHQNFLSKTKIFKKKLIDCTYDNIHLYVLLDWKAKTKELTHLIKSGKKVLL